MHYSKMSTNAVHRCKMTSPLVVMTPKQLINFTMCQQWEMLSEHSSARYGPTWNKLVVPVQFLMDRVHITNHHYNWHIWLAALAEVNDNGYWSTPSPNRWSLNVGLRPIGGIIYWYCTRSAGLNVVQILNLKRRLHVPLYAKLLPHLLYSHLGCVKIVNTAIKRNGTTH